LGDFWANLQTPLGGIFDAGLATRCSTSDRSHKRSGIISYLRYNTRSPKTENVCLFLCSLCTATVFSGSGPNLACGIAIPSGWSRGLASAVRDRGLALRAPGKFGTGGRQAREWSTSTKYGRLRSTASVKSVILRCGH